MSSRLTVLAANAGIGYAANRLVFLSGLIGMGDTYDTGDSQKWLKSQQNLFSGLLKGTLTFKCMITEISEPSEKVQTFLQANKKYAIVQCTHFRCVAYRLQDGTWRMANTNEELTEAVQLSEFF
jgi:hypothetical protein